MEARREAVTPETRDALRAQLIRHEGLRLRPYIDTVGKTTIGVGRNLDDRGISESEALFLLDNDIDMSIDELRARFEWFDELSEVRQRVLVDMAFNLGITKLLGFKRTLAAIKRGDYVAAAAGMMASKWATQVKRRAHRLAAMMREV
jgi:lysozyme